MIFYHYQEKVKILETLGDTLKMMGKYDESLIYYDRALSIDPKDINALYGKASAFRYIKNY